jgi:hypothetical protein
MVSVRPLIFVVCINPARSKSQNIGIFICPLANSSGFFEAKISLQVIYWLTDDYVVQ